MSALLYAENGQLVTQIDKALVSNILQVGSTKWEVGAQEDTYFLLPIPPATPPGEYALHVVVYGADTLARLPMLTADAQTPGGTLPLSPITIQPAQRPIELADLNLALPVNQAVLPGLNLVGFETLPAETVYSGNEIWASLLWQAGETLDSDLTMALIAQPVGSEEQISISPPTGLAGSGYPTSHWQPGELLRGWLKARIPPTLEPGQYALNLQLSPADQPEAHLLTLPIGEFQVQGWTRNFDQPSPQAAIGASFNQQALLVGLDANAAAVAPGETLNARLYWQAEAQFEQNYTAFIHVIGPDGQLYGQMDHIPGGGAFPTTGWLTGEFLTDEYAIQIAPEAPAGDYQLAIGMYNPDTGQRLTVSNSDCQTIACQAGDDAVRLPGLVVK